MWARRPNERAAIRSAVRTSLVGLVLASVLFVPSAMAAAPVCPNVPIPDRIAASDAAFVGRLVSSRPVAQGRAYRFVVDQVVKGPVGSEVEVRSTRLTDSEGTPLRPEVAVGVMARLDGSSFITDSCNLTDPGALLASFDEPRGNAIKVVIGIVLLAFVLAYAIVRRRRGTRPTLPRPDGS